MFNWEVTLASSTVTYCNVETAHPHYVYIDQGRIKLSSLNFFIIQVLP
jgi:hypothetical protein